MVRWQHIAYATGNCCVLKRGMLVNVSSQYTGVVSAIIIGFSFGQTQLPVLVSMGGAEGELVACVDFHEIKLFSTAENSGKVVKL